LSIKKLNLKKTLNKLLLITNLNEEDINNFKTRYKNLNKNNINVFITDNLSQRDISKIAVRLHEFPEVNFLMTKKRVYPQGAITSHLIGYTGKLTEQDLKRNKNLINTINDEIALKKDQIQRYQSALSNDAYSFVQFSQRKDEFLKLQKQKINLIGDQKIIKIDLFNAKLRSPIDGFILGINTRVGERPKNEGILDIGSSQKMEALIEVYESDIDRVFISQNVELSSENGGFQKNLRGEVIRISPQVKQRKVLSTDPTGDADSRIIEVLVKLDQDSINIVQNYAGMKVIAKFIP